MRNTIKILAKEFNKRNLTWAIGGSYLLKRYGIDGSFNELDIMVAEDSNEEMNNVMSELAVKLEVVSNENYQTDSFETYQIKDLTVNIICNLKCDFKEPFTYSFGKDDINTSEVHNNEKIYFSHLLDWYVIYQETNNKETSKLIERYYEDGSFLNNSRFNSKFGMTNIPHVRDNVLSLKKRIYHLG